MGISADAVYRRARKLGLSRRGYGARPKLSLADYRVQQNVQRMAETARAEQAAAKALQKAMAA